MLTLDGPVQINIGSCSLMVEGDATSIATAFAGKPISIGGHLLDTVLLPNGELELWVKDTADPLFIGASFSPDHAFRISHDGSFTWYTGNGAHPIQRNRVRKVCGLYVDSTKIVEV